MSRFAQNCKRPANSSCRFPDRAQFGMIWAVGEGCTFADDDLVSATQALVNTEALVDVAVLRHSPTAQLF